MVSVDSQLVGRQAALDVISAWAGTLANGPSAVLITGEAGIGKTMVWHAAVEAARAAGATVLVARPAEVELPLAHAALADLFDGLPRQRVTDVIADLPEFQRAALSGALSLADTPRPGDPLLVARSTRSAFERLAEAGPIVVAIDDAHWLDPASARALAYAARRLPNAAVGFVVSIRSGHADPIGVGEAVGGGLVHLALEGLSLGAIAHIVRLQGREQIARRTLVRIHQQSAGNPFYALELARAGAATLPATLTEMLGRRLDAVGTAGRSAVEEIAVLGPRPIAGFADLRGVDAAVDAGVLVADSDDVRFTHPLLAAEAYRRIAPGRRRALHEAAAEAAQSEVDRARHVALAATGPDPQLATQLEAAALSARMGGNPEIAAELAGQARRLTPRADQVGLARRTMDEAEYLFLAADEAGAQRLVESVVSGPVRGSVRVRALVQLALTQREAATAVELLEEAVLEPHDDPVLATRTLAQLAWQRGAWLGDVAKALPEAREAVKGAEELGDESTLVTALTTLGLILSISEGAGAQAQFEHAIEILHRAPNAAGDHTPHLAYAHERWWRGDFATAEQLLAGERRRAIELGDDGTLMRLAIFGAEFELRRGRWTEAEQLLDEALLDARDYWRLVALIQRGILRGRRGDPQALDDAAELGDASKAGADPVFSVAAEFVAGLMDLARGQVATAADRMAMLPEHVAGNASRRAEFAITIPEATAALVAAGDLDRARALTRQLEERVAQLEPWGIGAVAYCHGLITLAEGDAAGALEQLRDAAATFERIGSPFELAHALLATGNALRRGGHRHDAAAALERAASIFTELGAEPARAAADEALRRTNPRPRSGDGLTPTERRVAALVAEGRTNRETAARLFTTVATVEAHLTRIYGKVGVRSRTELARRVSDGGLQLDVDARD